MTPEKEETPTVSYLEGSYIENAVGLPEALLYEAVDAVEKEALSDSVIPLRVRAGRAVEATAPILAKHYEEKGRKEVEDRLLEACLTPEAIKAAGDAALENGLGHKWVAEAICRCAAKTIVAALASQEVEQSTDAITVCISVEGAKSFVSDSPGWGAMGNQEVTEALLDSLLRLGLKPPFAPKEPTDAH